MDGVGAGRWLATAGEAMNDKLHAARLQFISLLHRRGLRLLPPFVLEPAAAMIAALAVQCMSGGSLGLGELRRLERDIRGLVAAPTLTEG